MADMYNGSDIVEIAVEIEKNGKAFYDTIARTTTDEKLASVSTYLAGEEEKHIATFGKLLKSVKAYEPKAAYSDEYFAYMRALAGDYVFTKKNTGEEVARKVGTAKEAVEIAIGFEKDSILFYENMKRFVQTSDWKIINDVISEEHSHLIKLLDLRSRMSDV